MAAKRKISTHAERIVRLPKDLRDAEKDRWRGWYAPLLSNESPGKVEAFIKSQNERIDLLDELILGHAWRAQQDARHFLILLGFLGVRLPPHFAEILELEKVPSWMTEPQAHSAVMKCLAEKVESRDQHFFGDIAALMEGLPERKTSDLIVAVEAALENGKKVHRPRKDAHMQSRGRSYLQRLIFAALDVRIRHFRRLPTVEELRLDVNRLIMPKPTKRAFMSALVALGLSPRVLA